MSLHITVSREEFAAGQVRKLPAGVSYLRLSLKLAGVGEIPSTPSVTDNTRACDDRLFIDVPGRALDPDGLTCTCPVGHEMPHVAHVPSLAPVAAWTDGDSQRLDRALAKILSDHAHVAV